MRAPPTPEERQTIGAGREWLRARMKAREPAACPLCKRKVSIARRRIHSAQAETFLALARASLRRASQSDPSPWIHVEHDLVQAGLAPSVGRDWSQLRHWRLIEPKTSDRNPSGQSAGLWRLTKFGREVFEHPRRELLPAWVDTWNKRAWAYSPKRVSLVSCLGRAFDYDEEVAFASRRGAA